MDSRRASQPPRLGDACDGCGITVRRHCFTGLPTLKQIIVGPSLATLVEIESWRIWVRQQDNNSNKKDVGLICSAVRGAEATGECSCITGDVEQWTQRVGNILLF